MGGSSRQPTVTTSSNAPWSDAQPFMRSAMNEAQNLYNNDVGFRPYTGQMQAGLDGRTTDALGSAESIARQGNQGFRGAFDALSGMASGQGMGAEDPYLTTMLDANARTTANRVNSSMSGAGRYGSGAHTELLSRGITEATAPLLYQANEAGRQRQMQAAQMLPQAYDAQFAPSRQLAGIGDFYQGREQEQINNLIARHDQAENRPWQLLAQANAIYGGAGAMGGTGTRMTPYQGPSTAQSALGGAIAGGAQFGPIGALGGGLLGLL
jgi:hypothetical protein